MVVDSATSTSRGETDEASPTQDRPSARSRWHTAIINGVSVQVKRSPNCVVCNSAERDAVERGLLMGWTYLGILRSLPEYSSIWLGKDGEPVDEERASRRIGEHVRNGHSNRDHVVARTVMEAWAESEGMDMNAAKGTIVTEIGLLKDVVRRGYEAMVESGDSPSIRETIHASSILLRYRQAAEGTNAEVFSKAIEAVFALVGDKFGEGAMQWLYSEMERSPEVNAAIDAMAIEAAVE